MQIAGKEFLEMGMSWATTSEASAGQSLEHRVALIDLT